MPICPICKKSLTKRASSWSYLCQDCNHWIATLEAKIENTEDPIFQTAGESGDAISFLDDVRRKTSKIILDRLEGFGLGRLLDVGCASGLFLSLAAKRGFNVYGIEPNPRMAGYSIKSNIPTRAGFFPDILDENERFDIISFNDVLEHIESIDRIFGGCHKHLADDGLLSINVPNCKGFFFNIARALNRFGYAKPWERLWQTMFYTPHLHYFSPKSLIKAAKNYGFSPVGKAVYLPVIGLSGLWGRLSADIETKLWVRALQYIAIIITYPFYALATKDSFFIVFKKTC